MKRRSLDRGRQRARKLFDFCDALLRASTDNFMGLVREWPDDGRREPFRPLRVLLRARRNAYEWLLPVVGNDVL